MEKYYYKPLTLAMYLIIAFRKYQICLLYVYCMGSVVEKLLIRFLHVWNIAESLF